jgi:hypothetical protein
MTYASWDLLFGKINYYLGVLNLLPGSKKYQGKFNAEEVEIIKEFQKNPIIDPELEVDTRLFSKYEEKLSDNKLVRWAIFSLIVEKQGAELLHLLRQHHNNNEFDADKWAQSHLRKIDAMLKKKKSGRQKIKKKRGRPKKR